MLRRPSELDYARHGHGSDGGSEGALEVIEDLREVEDWLRKEDDAVRV